MNTSTEAYDALSSRERRDDLPGWGLTVPLTIVAGFIVWTLIVLAVVNALSRSDWPAACEGLTTAAECAARMGQQ